MPSAGAFVFPPNATIASWRRELSPLRTLWAAHLLCHRVEASVRVAASAPLEPLDAIALRAFARERTVDRVARRLALPEAMASAWVRRLGAVGLLSHAEEGWALTPEGSEALARGAVVASAVSRQTFVFVERLGDTGARLGEPTFLPLPAGPFRVWAPPSGATFRPDTLLEALRWPAARKAALGFPSDTVGLASDPGDWRRTVVVRDEQLLAALVEREGSLTAHAIRPETMMPHPAPLFTLGPDARESLTPFLPAGPSVGSIRVLSDNGLA